MQWPFHSPGPVRYPHPCSVIFQTFHPFLVSARPGLKGKQKKAQGAPQQNTRGGGVNRGFPSAQSRDRNTQPSPVVALTTAPGSHPKAEWVTETILISTWDTSKFQSSQVVKVSSLRPTKYSSRSQLGPNEHPSKAALITGKND